MKKKKFDFELLVIGGGVAGREAAMTSALLGFRTGIIEYNKWGTNTNSGMMHTAMGAGLKIAHLYRSAVEGARFGLSSNNLRFNYPAIINSIDLAKKRSEAGEKNSLLEKNIKFIDGFAHFLGPNEVAVGEQRITAEKILIATGRDAGNGQISGLENVSYILPENMFNIRLPQAVMVVGAGATGCEIAQFFASFGSKVLLADLSSRILPKEDEEIGLALENYLYENLDVTVLTQSRIVAIEKDTVGKKVIFIRGGEEKMVRVEEVVLATEKSPALDCGLENAGIKYQKNGIIVDKFLKTSMKHIYAAGGVIGGSNSLEKAAYQGRVAAKNLLLNTKISVNYEAMMRTVRVSPEVATVGMNEDDCIKQGIKYKKKIVFAKQLPAANLNDFQDGFLKLLTNEQGQIIGGVAFGLEASGVLQEVSLAIKQKITAKELANTPHLATSWNELVRLASIELIKK